MSKLSGKIALITGGTTGIGLATAVEFQKQGATVIVTGRNPKTLEEARKTLGSRATVVSSDAASIQDIDALAGMIKEKFGRLDIVFANAGIAQFAPLEESAEEFFDRQFNLNVRGLYFLVQRAAPLMGEGGSILLNASVVSAKGLPGTSVYSATKAAVRSFGRSLAAELAPRGIRVNTISPGPIATPIYEKLGMPKDAQAGFEANMAQGVALKRFGRPEEIATVATFLASSDSSYLVGTEIFADGGMGEL